LFKQEVESAKKQELKAEHKSVMPKSSAGSKAIKHTIGSKLGNRATVKEVKE